MINNQYKVRSRHLSHLMRRHLTLGGLVGLQAFTEHCLDGLHLGGDGLERLLIVLLPLQSLIQALLLLAYLQERRTDGCSYPEVWIRATAAGVEPVF